MNMVKASRCVAGIRHQKEADTRRTMAHDHQETSRVHSFFTLSTSALLTSSGVDGIDLHTLLYLLLYLLGCFGLSFGFTYVAFSTSNLNEIARDAMFAFLPLFYLKDYARPSLSIL